MIQHIKLAAGGIIFLSLLGGCADFKLFDPDLRESRYDTSDAARNSPAGRPKPDARGVISYPKYQVAVAREGDSLRSLANRVGISVAELARYNGLQEGTRLRQGELVALPTRVAAGPSVSENISSGPVQSGGNISVAELGSGTPSSTTGGITPLQHKVVRGETAYTIARLYNISVRRLADWNGLGSNLAVREGQILLIPPGGTTAQSPVTKPGEGSATPIPPSAVAPLPEDEASSVSAAIQKPPTPEIGQSQTKSKFARPVQGRIIRDFQKGKTDGIDIAADVGTTVRAAEQGTVAAITSDADQVPIVVVKHRGNLLTVYANIGGIVVAKGDKVQRGQKIGKIRPGVPSYLHFEVRQGFESVDPSAYIN